MKRTKSAMKWLLNSGLCVNKKKTEVCVLQQKNSRANKVVLGNDEICVLKHIKILGLICDSKLNWYYQTVNAI
jgi:hypothetical protein